MLTTGLFETRSARLIVSVVATLAAMIASLLLAPGVAHAYEVHLSISGAGTVDEDPALTQANILDPACVSPQTTPTGTVGANCYPGDPNGDYGWGWVVQWKATPAQGWSFVRWESDGSPKPVICDQSTPAATTSTYTGTSCGFKTFDNLQTRAVFADTTAPNTPAISGPSQFTNQQTATFNFSSFLSDPTFKQYECRVTPTVQTSFQPCSSGVSFTPAADGTYTLEVRARDYSNNLSGINSYTWTLDRVKPETTL